MKCKAGFAITSPMIAEIFDMQELSRDTTLFTVALETKGRGTSFCFLPGQFVQLSVPAGGEIPISMSGMTTDGKLELCVRRAGHVTSILHRRKKGDPLGVLGPLGNGFPLHEWKGRDVLLIAGGLGMAPMRALLSALLEERSSFRAITLMYGAKEPAAMLFRWELAELSRRSDLKVFLTVDLAGEETPEGLQCRVGLLPSLLDGSGITGENTIAAACGPPALYGCLMPELMQMGFPPTSLYLSLERRMNCGIGRCCHCAIGDYFCCTDGPVFSWAKLQHVRGAL